MIYIVIFQAQREIEEKNQEVQSTQLEMEKLQRSVRCEREKYATLELELATTSTEIQQAQGRCERLTLELQHIREGKQDEV